MQLWQLRQKVHSSWFIAVASVGIVLGAALVPYVKSSIFAPVIWVCIAITICVIVLWQRSVCLVPLMIMAGIVCGLWRGSVLESDLAVYRTAIGHRVTLSGTVNDDPDIGKHGELLLRLNDVAINQHAVPGKVWVSTIGKGELKRGDHIVVSGKLSEGFGSFAAVMYRGGVEGVQRPQPGDVARQVRDWYADKIRLGIREPQVSLGLGYLLGQRRALPPELSEALVVTGLTHVVVASGYNLTILVRLARRLFEKVSKYLSTVAAVTMIVGFMAITGASPSMSRAGLVAGLSLVAWYYGRRFHPLVLLPFAAAVTVLVDPTYAWNDLGWQLSFAAFAGVMILAPLLQRYFFGDKAPGTVRQILGETVSASIVTLPILVFAFGQFSNVAILTNLLILPFVPLAMLLTFVAGMGGILAPGVASVIGMPAQTILTYMTEVIHLFAGLSWARTIVEIQAWMVGGVYIVIVAVCIYLWKVTKHDLNENNLVK